MTGHPANLVCVSQFAASFAVGSAMITESQVKIALKLSNIMPAPEADGLLAYRIDDLRNL